MDRPSRDTRKVMTRLVREGWIQRKGKGDHMNYSKPGVAQLITIDSGEKEVDKNIFKRICKIAGWS